MVTKQEAIKSLEFLHNLAFTRAATDHANVILKYLHNSKPVKEKK